MQYLVMALYAALICIMVFNVRKILIQQRRYKTLPLLFFYIYTFITLSTRLIGIIWFYDVFQQPNFLLILEISIAAKLCVGLV